MNAYRIVDRLLEASTPEDFERVQQINTGALPHPGYQDGWEPITPEIADFVGHDFSVCCEGSYRGPDRGFVYGENGKPRLIALVRNGTLSYVAGWKAPRGSRAATPEERNMAAQLTA